MTVTTPNNGDLLQKLGTLLHFSIRSGKAVLGQNRLGSMKYKKIGLVLLNGDVSPNTERDITGKIGVSKIVKLKEGTDIGAMTGRSGVKVLGLIESELQKEIFRLLKTYERT